MLQRSKDIQVQFYIAWYEMKKVARELKSSCYK